MGSGDVSAAIAALQADVDGLLAVPVEGLAPIELTSALEAVEVQRRRLEAVDQRLLAAASAAGVAASLGQPGLAPVLTSLLRVDAREARARVGRAVDRGPRRALSGEPLEPLLPVVADAVERGGGVGGAGRCDHRVSGADPADRPGRGRAGRRTAA